MIAFFGLDCHASVVFLAIKERDGDPMSDRYYWIREPENSLS